jgi:hypothetical protein
MVQDLVHPSMYPLVYGRSKVLQEEVVGVSCAIDKWAGKGKVIEDNNTPSEDEIAYSRIPPEHWSNTYQWLPANVAFQKDGTVKFTSYINNLHPIKYSQIYGTIEELIETSLPLWEQCLTFIDNWANHDKVGRPGSRFASALPENME